MRRRSGSRPRRRGCRPRRGGWGPEPSPHPPMLRTSEPSPVGAGSHRRCARRTSTPLPVGRSSGSGRRGSRRGSAPRPGAQEAHPESVAHARSELRRRRPSPPNPPRASGRDRALRAPRRARRRSCHGGQQDAQGPSQAGSRRRKPMPQHTCITASTAGKRSLASPSIGVRIVATNRNNT